MYEKEAEQLKALIDEAKNIVFFGGAGVSTESHIPDFRSAEGLYSERGRFSPEEIVSHTFFVKHPEEFYEFYKDKMIYLDAQPNPAHLALARLEAAGKVKAVVTQNIDGLHQKAGSKTVYELHGSVHRNYCQKCGKFYDARYVKESEGIPHCSCGGVIKPDVVLYEEGLDSATIEKSIKAISQADLLIVGGTSLVVYPAASFIDYFRGKHLVLINKGETGRHLKTELTINAPIGAVFEQVERMQ